jgi:hypothetical protein
MEHLHDEKAKLTEEIRILRKISNATKIASRLRTENRDTAADCIESLIREIERIRKEC